jgi:molybdenum cofactor synthesis domain-containing protein
MTLRIAILTCSDSRARGEAADESGPALARACEAHGWTAEILDVVPDDRAGIAAAIAVSADSGEIDVLLTTGGTGFGPRDVTPEATLDVCDREAPGIAEAIRAGSMEITRRAMLSRGVAGLRESTLVVNVPGSPKAATESLALIADQLEHAVEMIAGSGHD